LVGHDGHPEKSDEISSGGARGGGGEAAGGGRGVRLARSSCTASLGASTRCARSATGRERDRSGRGRSGSVWAG